MVVERRCAQQKRSVKAAGPVVFGEYDIQSWDSFFRIGNRSSCNTASGGEGMVVTPIPQDRSILQDSSHTFSS